MLTAGPWCPGGIGHCRERVRRAPDADGPAAALPPPPPLLPPPPRRVLALPRGGAGWMMMRTSLGPVCPLVVGELDCTDWLERRERADRFDARLRLPKMPNTPRRGGADFGTAAMAGTKLGPDPAPGLGPSGPWLNRVPLLEGGALPWPSRRSGRLCRRDAASRASCALAALRRRRTRRTITAMSTSSRTRPTAPSTMPAIWFELSPNWLPPAGNGAPVCVGVTVVVGGPRDVVRGLAVVEGGAEVVGG